MKTQYPFLCTRACLDIPGEHADYRIDITCNKILTKEIYEEATDLLKRLGEALNEAEQKAAQHDQTN